jgi:hypothetical protein
MECLTRLVVGSLRTGHRTTGSCDRLALLMDISCWQSDDHGL